MLFFNIFFDTDIIRFIEVELYSFLDIPFSFRVSFIMFALTRFKLFNFLLYYTYTIVTFL